MHDEEDDALSDYMPSSALRKQGFEPRAKDGEPVLLSPFEALPLAVLRDSLRTHKHEFFEQKGVCLVLEVAGPDWVKPVAEAARRIAEWDLIFTGGQKAYDSDTVLRRMSDGGRLLCVSSAPKSDIPETLLAVADRRVRVAALDDASLRHAVRLITGKSVRGQLPSVGSMGFFALCACLRRGSDPKSCRARLQTAASLAAPSNTMLSEVPLLGELRGYGRAGDWAKRLVADLQLWREGSLALHDIQRRAVLFGAPGTGKTLLAKSIARTAGLPFFASSVGSWFAESNGYLDGVLRRVDKLFADAAAVAPAVVLLDELDAIPDRSALEGSNAAWWTTMVTHVLTMLDGAASKTTQDLIIIGATNDPRLDAALLRPGRLSPLIEIDVPGPDEMALILRQYLGDQLPDLALAELAQIGGGASGAQAAEWVKEARARARSEGRAMVPNDLVETIAPKLSGQEHVDRRIALHETGHAIMAEALEPGSVQSVSVRRRAHGGVTLVRFKRQPTTRREIEEVTMFVLAGLVAEELLLGDVGLGAGGDARSDLARATELLAGNLASFGMGDSLLYRGPPEEVAKLLSFDPHLRGLVEDDLSRLREECRQRLDTRRDDLERIAELLLQNGLVAGDALRRELMTTEHANGYKH